MRSSFSEVNTNFYTRKFGGTSVGVADPYVTGYHFIIQAVADQIYPALAMFRMYWLLRVYQ